MTGDEQTFQVLLHAIAAGPIGLPFGDLSRRVRRGGMIDVAQLRSLLGALTARGIVTEVPRGRSMWYAAGPRAREVLAVINPPSTDKLRYRADDLRRVWQFMFEGSRSLYHEAEAVWPTEKVVDTAGDLAQEASSGLVSLADLRRATGLSRAVLHATVKAAVAEGLLILHPLAARRQTPGDEDDGIRTPGGQNLFYVQVATVCT